MVHCPELGCDDCGAGISDVSWHVEHGFGKRLPKQFSLDTCTVYSATTFMETAGGTG